MRHAGISSVVSSIKSSQTEYGAPLSHISVYGICGMLKRSIIFAAITSLTGCCLNGLLPPLIRQRFPFIIFQRFFRLPSEVLSGVLIPRPETAELVDLIVKENPDARRLLDIGTGSGCIAISLDKNLPDAKVDAWDISEEALAIARKNNEELDAQVTFRRQDVFSADGIQGASYDIIVSNPPYVTETEKTEMEANVLDWEPELALFVPDEDPLRFYRRIAELGRELLRPGGKLYFEINQAYGQDMIRMIEMNQYRDVRVIKDIFGKDRILTANR